MVRRKKKKNKFITQQSIHSFPLYYRNLLFKKCWNSWSQWFTTYDTTNSYEFKFYCI